MQDRTHELIPVLLKLVRLALSPAWASSISPILFWCVLLVEVALAVVVVVWFCRLPWSRRHAVAAIPTGIVLSICLLAALNVAINVLAVAVRQILRKDT